MATLHQSHLQTKVDLIIQFKQDIGKGLLNAGLLIIEYSLHFQIFQHLGIVGSQGFAIATSDVNAPL